MVSCDKLEMETEAFYTAFVNAEGDTTKLDEYFSEKLEAIAECRHSHWQCFASCGVSVVETPAISTLGSRLTRGL